MNESSIWALWEGRLISEDAEAHLRLSLETRVTGDIAVISCVGRMVYGNESGDLFAEIEALLPKTREIVIDLSGVDMIDGAGLGELVSVAVKAQAGECSIKLAAPSNFILRVLRLTNLTAVFEIYPTLEAAILAFGERASVASAGF